jgi:hypothetical protein
MRPMSPSTRATYLLLAILWQALMWLTPYGLARKSQETAHMVVHAQTMDHHHHADQSLHLEETTDESTHQHTDAGMQPAGLLPFLSAQLPHWPSLAPDKTVRKGAPSVFLEGPLRPPQLA